MLPSDRTKYLTEKQVEYYLKGKLTISPVACVHCLMIVYSNQTTDEKDKENTTKNNDIGFAKPHVKKLSRIAEKVELKIKLKGNDFQYLMNVMPHYWRQYVNKIGWEVIKNRMAIEMEQIINKTKKQ